MPLSLTEQTWNKLRRNTVAITGWTWNGVNRASKTTVDFVATMTCKVCGGVKFTAECIFDNVPFIAEWTWQRILWMARWVGTKQPILQSGLGANSLNWLTEFGIRLHGLLISVLLRFAPSLIPFLSCTLYTLRVSEDPVCKVNYISKA